MFKTSSTNLNYHNKSSNTSPFSPKTVTPWTFKTRRQQAEQKIPPTGFPWHIVEVGRSIGQILQDQTRFFSDFWGKVYCLGFFYVFVGGGWTNSSEEICESQIGSFPQWFGVNIKNVWNHHLVLHWKKNEKNEKPYPNYKGFFFCRFGV